MVRDQTNGTDKGQIMLNFVGQLFSKLGAHEDS